MKIVRSFFTVFSLILYINLGAQAADAPPQVPYIQQDVCPFECCLYGKWIAKGALTVYKKEGGNSSVAFTIKPGEEFHSIRGNVHIVKLGIVALEKSFDGFAKGDKVYVLSYRGEGVYDLWHKGKGFESNDQFWANGVLTQSPEMIWWVLVRNKDGKQGWLKLKNISENGFKIEEEIDGMDSCS